MTNRLFAILRYTAAVALVAGLFTLAGCDSDDGDAGPTTFDGSIYAYITQPKFKQADPANGNNPDTALDSLVMYLDKPQFAELKTILSSSQELTLFAPSNAAFKNLTALPGLADPDKVNQSIIKAVLAYHVVPGKKTSSDLTAGASLNTMYLVNGTTPDVIKVNADGQTLFTGSSNDKIAITTKDQMTTNGVVHTTATVLIPNAIGGQLKNILGTIAASVLLGGDFTYLAYLINRSEVGATAENSITLKLSNRDAKLTFLATPNAVMKMVAAKVLEKADPTDAEIMAWLTAIPADDARALVANHIIDGQYTVAASSSPNVTQFANGATIDDEKVFSGNVFYSVATGLSVGECSCTTGVVLIGPGSQKAPILIPDIDSEAAISNGVVQVIGGLIFTPTPE